MKIGVLGGTFNPIHKGHIAMAEYVLKTMGMDKICFLPNGIAPHKDNNNIVESRHRVNMIKLAIKDIENFYVSDYEVQKEGNCYTIDTIKYLNSLDDEYYYIIGADSLFQINTWKSSKDLLKIGKFIVCDRLGEGDTVREIERLNSLGCNFSLCQMPFVDISSTQVRDNVKNGKDISDLVGKSVMDYIVKLDLYK